jgi:hypothetical protein
MNLFVAMIPFLLMSASFFHLSIVSASIPTIAEDDTVFQLSDKSVNMTIQIKKNGYKVSGGSEKITDAEIKALKSFIPKQGKDYNVATLSKTLYRIKTKYPRSESVVIVPEKDINFQVIIATMDATREIEVAAGKREPLFPASVLSSMIQ